MIQVTWRRWGRNISCVPPPCLSMPGRSSWGAHAAQDPDQCTRTQEGHDRDRGANRTIARQPMCQDGQVGPRDPSSERAQDAKRSRQQARSATRRRTTRRGSAGHRSNSPPPRPGRCLSRPPVRTSRRGWHESSWRPAPLRLALPLGRGGRCHHSRRERALSARAGAAGSSTPSKQCRQGLGHCGAGAAPMTVGNPAGQDNPRLAHGVAPRAVKRLADTATLIVPPRVSTCAT